MNECIATAVRPSDEENWIGNYYYPEGIPSGTSDPCINNQYKDEDGETFWICYTGVQMENHIKRNCGIMFPYIPLLISDRI